MNERISVAGFIHRQVRSKKLQSEVLGKIARLEDQGYPFEMAPASLELLIKRCLERQPLPFEVCSYHVSDRGLRIGNETNHICEASIKLIVKGKVVHEVCEGTGPLHALDGAIRSALNGSFKGLDKICLRDYSVKMLNGTSGTSAKISVLIQSGVGDRKWWTVGVSQNVIEASLEALVDSIEYALVFLR